MRFLVGQEILKTGNPILHQLHIKNDKTQTSDKTPLFHLSMSTFGDIFVFSDINTLTIYLLNFLNEELCNFYNVQVQKFSFFHQVTVMFEYL